MTSAPAATSAPSTAIPIIDLGRWRSGDESERTAVAAAVDQALQTSGFLVVTGHGISTSLIDDARRVALEAFALPESTKDRYRQREGIGSTGWIPLGAEANGYASGEETPPDLKEAWSTGPTGDAPLVMSSGGLVPSIDRFPSEVSEFRPVITRYLDENMELAAELFHLLAVAAGVPDDTFLRQCRAPLHTLNLTWYPAVDRPGGAAPGQYRIGPHSDFGTITILQREESDPPLQVQMPDGEWIDLPHVDGGFVINVGDLLAFWSGGRWRSNPHRILAPTGAAARESRLSLVLFIETDVGAELRPIDDPEAEPIDALEHLRQQLAAIDTVVS